ncbi:hypothetical protein OG21DRAFT_1049053 [Imleria badia]|nr:hypothetical protein OG21DRAFT_1049053 [Imleria badia]
MLRMGTCDMNHPRPEQASDSHLQGHDMITSTQVLPLRHAIAGENGPIDTHSSSDAHRTAPVTIPALTSIAMRAIQSILSLSYPELHKCVGNTWLLSSHSFRHLHPRNEPVSTTPSVSNACEFFSFPHTAAVLHMTRSHASITSSCSPRLTPCARNIYLPRSILAPLSFRLHHSLSPPLLRTPALA